MDILSISSFVIYGPQFLFISISFWLSQAVMREKITTPAPLMIISSIPEPRNILITDTTIKEISAIISHPPHPLMLLLVIEP